MAFGIKREELNKWKELVQKGDRIVFITHYWIHPKFPNIKTVTKAGCSDLSLLKEWGRQYGLKPEWIHKREEYPHFDLIGDHQIEILIKEGVFEQLERFSLKKLT
ncbi:hypothetical protein JOC85_003940 [Bacillus mesophilus]|uniref:YneQ n=1 Tax=Bacillus mesophilus TaxID=1808955 RepID=A0A6M0QBD7_9BACI|nr:hypothetical protein [Bacillus mesophilus]NEY73567.1 hypothetical protein [Bacillus mesophilus]